LKSVVFNNKGKDINMEEYFLEKYKIQIKNPKQPLIVVHRRE
jgi:hypothetical protein